MVKLIVAVFVMLGTLSLHAQDSNPAIGADSAEVLNGAGAKTADSGKQEAAQLVEPSEPYTLGVGVSIGLYGGGIAVENAEGRKVNPAFWALPSYSAVIYAPFGRGSMLGARLDIGVSSTGTQTRPYEFYSAKSNWEGSFTEKYTYFTIAPQVSFAGALLGVGFNFPMSGERYNKDMSQTTHYVDKDLLTSPKIDLRLGGMITAWDSPLGKLLVELQAKYDLMGTFKDDMYVYGHPSDSKGIRNPNYLTAPALNLTTASFSVGIAYLFNVGL